MGDTLSTGSFEQALADLRGRVDGDGGGASRLVESFVADTPAKLRALFAAGAGGC